MMSMSIAMPTTRPPATPSRAVLVSKGFQAQLCVASRHMLASRTARATRIGCGLCRLAAWYEQRKTL